MHATQATTASTDTIQTRLAEPGEPYLEGFLRNVSQLDGVHAEPKPSAHCCGAIGCRLTENLARLRISGFGKRVLCPIHVLDLVDREVGLDD